jgi:hypothetical protein
MEPGKSNCVTCAGLLRLCGNLDFFPADAEVRKLLVERLHGLARDHQQAKAMIDRWISGHAMAPKVSDLVGLAAETRKIAEGPLPAGCEVCDGANWVMAEKGMTRCSCQRGQALRRWIVVANRSRKAARQRGR